MNKKFLLIILLALSIVTVGLYSFFYLSNKNSLSTSPIITIAQIIEHNTLDTVRAGFMHELKQQGFLDGNNSIRVIYENAHGNFGTVTQIINKFAGLKPAVMVGLSTQTAQALLNITESHRIPLVFSAVTDPVAAKLIPGPNTPTPWVTGVSDFMPAKPQLMLLRDLMPHLNRLGILYNPSEVNSVAYLDYIKKAAQDLGIELILAPLNSTAEAGAATASLINRVEAIYFPNDNTAMAAVRAIVQTAHKYHLPVFANDVASVERGAVAALAYDRFAMGEKTAEMVIAILKGTNPSAISISYDTPMNIVVNKAAADKTNIQIPPHLLQSIRLVKEVEDQ